MTGFSELARIGNRVEEGALVVTVLVLAPAPVLAPVPMVKVQEVGQPCLKAGMKGPEFSHQVPGEQAYIGPQLSLMKMALRHFLIWLVFSS